MIRSFEFAEEALISSKEILDEAGKIKENMASPLSANSFGVTVLK